MIRKQLYIPPEMDRELEIAARKEGKREAQLIREFLAAGLRMEVPIENAGTFLLDLAAIGAKGPKDLSTNIFDYLYGDKSPNYGKNKPRLTKREIEHINKFVNERTK